MSHTTEPWSIESAVNEAWILFDEAENRTIGLIGEIQHSNSGEIPREAYLENARRIMACVNAYVGLNPAAYRECVEALRKLLDLVANDKIRFNSWKLGEELYACYKAGVEALAHAQEER